MEMFNIIKNYFVVTWQRFKSETPRYWRRLSNISLALTALAGFLTENDAVIPEDYKYITKYITAMAAAVALVSRFATTNTELAEKSEDLLLKQNANKNIDTV